MLEPILDIEVKVPEEYMGDIMGDISGKRGKIMGMESDGTFQIIKAQVPQAEVVSLCNHCSIFDRWERHTF